MKPLRGFVHYATFPNVATPGQLRESLAIVLDRGFVVVELSTQLGDALLALASRILAARGATLFISAGPEFVRTPRSLCDPRRAERGSAVQRALALVDLANRLGAANLMLCSGADPGREQRAAARAALEEALRRIGDHARGLRVTIETFPRDRAPAQLLGPSAESASFITEIALPHLGITTDLAHLVQLGEVPASSAATLAVCSTHVHLSTCILKPGHALDGDAHPTFEEPGIALSVADAARAITARVAPDVVSVEIRRHHHEPAAAFVDACARSWDAAVSAVIDGAENAM